MSYTPVELRHIKVGRRLFGYHRAAIDQVIAEVADSFEVTWRERGELSDQVETLEKRVSEHRRREDLLTETLVAAEKAAGEVRDSARRQAEEILREANEEARAISRAATAERDRLLAEARRIEAMMRAALGMINESTVGVPVLSAPLQEAAKPLPLESPEVGWPREDTHEFEPIVVPEIEAREEPGTIGQLVAGGVGRDPLGFDWGA